MAHLTILFERCNPAFAFIAVTSFAWAVANFTQVPHYFVQAF